MKMNTHAAQFLILILGLLCHACDTKKETSSALPEKVVMLENVETKLPDAPGADLFQANCQTCHSLRYIQMQPPFPEATWKKIVDKMVKAYGAPIPDSSSEKIVEYLVTIRGKK